MECVQKHFDVKAYPKTPEAIEAERYLVCLPYGKNRFLTLKCIPFSRWYLFAAAFICQFCCGSLYAWSIYNVPMDTYIYGNKSEGKAVYAFYIAVGGLGFTAAALGPWLERNGPRAGLLLGASMFLIGNVIAAISLWNRNVIGIYIGYGVFCGFGLGINYISPVSAMQKWFPDLRGTAAGFAVGGFGAGSIVWGKVYLPSAAHFGLPGSFLFLGILMSAVMYLCALVVRIPPPDFTVGGVNLHGIAESTTSEAKTPVAASYQHVQDIQENDTKNEKQEHLKQIKNLKLVDCLVSIDYFFMYLMLAGNIVFGVVAMSRLSTMATVVFGKTAAEGSTIVSINGAFNCCGRLFVPMISDVIVHKLGVNPPLARKFIFLCTLTGQLVILLTLPTIMRNQNYGAFQAVMWVLTLCYGGGFGTIPCYLTDMFGVYNIGALHGFILTAWSIAGVGGGLGFTFHYNHLVKTGVPAVEAYIENINWIVITVIVGFVAMFFVRTNAGDRFAPGYQYSVCDKPIVKIGGKKKVEESSESQA